MSVLSDKWIRKMSNEEEMISPFEEKQVRGDSISYGLSSYGYDARVSDEFKIFTNVNSEIVDPKNFKPTNFVSKNTPECIIPPNSFALARTIEKFKIPNDVLVICLRKINIRKMWYYSKRYSIRTGLGRICYIRIFKYYPFACKNIC